MKYTTITSHQSKTSGIIEVRQTPDGHHHLVVDDIVQSGPIMPAIWHHAFNHLLPPRFVPENIIILGYGAGSSTNMVLKRWPGTHITGVEIDPVMLKLGTHFNPTRHQQVTNLNQDAGEFVNQLDASKYNFSTTLCLVDLSVGGIFPPDLLRNQYFDKLKQVANFTLINLIDQPHLTHITKASVHFFEKHYQPQIIRINHNLIVSLINKINIGKAKS